MKKLYLLLFASALLFSCAKDDGDNSPNNPDKKTERVALSVRGIMVNTPAGRAAGIPGNEITNPVIIDSLVKNIRVLVLEDVTGKCLTYGDFDPIKLSLDTILYMTVPVQMLDFIVLTNVTDPAVMPGGTSIIGKNRNEILAMLKPHASGKTNYYEQANQIFFASVENMNVKANPNFALGENKAPVHLVRAISQLETSVKQTEVYAVDGSNHATGSPITGYIVKIDTIMLRNVSPDMNMSKMLNNRAPLKDASNSILANSTFTMPSAGVPKNIMLSFPNEQLGAFPFVIIAATIDATNAFNTQGPTTTRYWALPLTYFLRENVRLVLNINKLLGQGKIVPPPPSPTATVEFDISLYDWDPTPDIEDGEANGF